MGIIKNLPTFERPREKAFLFGVEKLSNAELIAVLLGTGNRDEDALELSQKLINKCGSLKNLSHKTLSELGEIKGIKLAKAIKIKAAIELHYRIEKEKTLNIKNVNTIKEAAIIFKNNMPSFDKEHLLLLMLDSAKQIIGIQLISIGSTSGVIVSPNIVLTNVIKNNAKYFYIAHNHPSQCVFPSKEDKIQTENIKMLASLLGVNLIDHVIVTIKEYYSIFEERSFNF